MCSDADRFVLARIALGDENKQIAESLGVCVQTVKRRVSMLLRRFGVPNRAALAVATRDPCTRSHSAYRQPLKDQLT